MLKKHPGHRILGAALVLACGFALSACAVSLPGGIGAVILAIMVTVLVFRPPCARDAEASATDGNIVNADTGPDAPKGDSGGDKGAPDTKKGDIKTTPCLSPCLSTTACLCTCELSDPVEEPAPGAAPAASPDDVAQDLQRARDRLGRRLPDELKQRLFTDEA